MTWCPEDWERLGQMLRAARQRSGQSQQELARAAGVSIGSVQGAESGKPPRSRMPYTVPAIAQALGWPAGAVESVLSGKGEPTTPEVTALAQRLQRLNPRQRDAVVALLDAFEDRA